MTVIDTYIVRVKPGRLEDAIDLIRSSAKPLERLGARNVRLLRGAISAESMGQLVVTTEYDSNEAFGEAYDRMMADDELISIMARADAESSPFASQSSGTGMDIPLDAPTGRGNVIQVTLSRPHPGRYVDAVEISKQFAALFCDLGALGANLTWLGISGSLSGTFAFTLEFQNMAAMGRAGDAFMATVSARELLEEVSSANSPATILSQDVFSVIPL